MPIGNDIVDLQLAKIECNIFRKGYLEKVLTENEQQMMQKTVDPYLCFWQMWSMKEAVYKILRQKGEERGFYPKKIEVTKLNQKAGQVCYGQQLFFTQTVVNSTYLETIALEERRHFKHVFKLENNTPLDKNQEVPFIINHQTRQAVSKSHHGAFESIVTLLK